MKNIITGTLFTFLVVTGFCQSPNFFKYQAILRDKSGILISEKSVAMRISILKGTAEGSVLYSETHTLKTNSLGTINLEIGNGVVKSGTFVAIEWGSSIHFVKIEMDPLGGSAFEVVGVSQLLSVPYSLYAQKSGDEKWDNATGGINYAKGNVGIGKTNPISKLDVNGTINGTDVQINGESINNKLWSFSNSNLYFNSGNVGIGTNAPTVKLDINGGGDLNLLNLSNNSNSIGLNAIVSSETDYHASAIIGKRSRGSLTTPSAVIAGDRITGMYGSLFANSGYQNAAGIQFYVGANPGNSSFPTNIRFETTGTSETIRSERLRISENGNVGIGKTTPAYKLDVDGTVNAAQFLINGSPLVASSPWNSSAGNTFYTSGNVGIGTTTPSVKLDINGGGDLNLLNLSNDANSLGVNTIVSSNTDFHASAFIGKRSRGSLSTPLAVSAGDRITGIYGSLFANSGFQNAAGIQFYVGANPGSSSFPSNIRFETTSTNQTARTERLRISETGNVIIKTSDILIENIGSGVIMKSPDGNCWRMTVNNAGAPVFTSITCPQ